MGLRFRGWGFSVKGVLVAEFISPECALSALQGYCIIPESKKCKVH